MTTPALDIDTVTVRYDSVTALDRVSLALAPGRVCGLVGTNGSGKSTLFKTIMGLVRPVSGRVSITGGSTAAARRKGAVAYVPQSEAVDWDFPIGVRDVVMTGRFGRQGFIRRPRPADRAAVEAALDRVGMTDFATRQIGQLSGGQRKRVFVARAIAQEAPLLLLDEPFAGVDTKTQQALTTVIRDLAASGHAVLVATHDLTGLPLLCDEAVLLQRRLLVHGSPDEVLRPENLALAFGASPADSPAGPPTVREVQ
ncbi:metal ABC transporter ATP-binding protein [Rhodococcus coprophilus]|uniref:Manganese ABC transporter ATP-binding protein n=1 Tax=Rhodococcus coprophilus TaxID=38310 RepID=A0A2X4U2C8_9NOCA|nr:metal ABC transporter ATP-binding protein [Rhodococcus coprophilus]MBM7461327.1 manganese transport system ATP-binding protein [Rhodococcus coprophilus]SQI29248.1 manganese ABC transporter ATP-binding protein [Rhodococcus coprophilus]